MGAIIKFTTEEINFIKENYKQMSDLEIGLILGRTESGIKSKRQKLRLLHNSGRISVDNELKERIINLYESGEQIKKIQDITNIHETNLHYLLKEWGVFKPRQNRWSKEELEILKNKYQYISNKDLIKLLPNKSIEQITIKASALKLGKSNYYWSNEDEMTLINNFGKIPIEEIEKMLCNKYTIKAIQTKAFKLGITKNNQWEQHEVDYLVSNYEIVGLDEMCKIFPHRKREYIARKASDLGLKNPLFWSIEDDKFIHDNWLTLSDYDIAKNIQRTKRAVKWRRSQLGLERPTGGYGNGCVDDFGNTFDSQEEKIVFEFIRDELNFEYIKCISRNHNKNGKYVFNVNTKDGITTAYPDYVIEYISINNEMQKLKKPIILEYYGMYNTNKKNKIIQAYVKKTQLKNEYYRSKDDVYFIPIYPKDLKNNFEGLREKLSSFFMDNFRIDILNNKNKIAG